MPTQTETDVSLAVSTVIFALRPDANGELMTLWTPLVRRIRTPHEGRWALPGGPLIAGVGLAESANHTLGTTTGLAPKYLEQLYAFGAIDRSPDRVVSIVYWALVQADEASRTNDDENVRWFPADDLPDLAFDHNSIVDYALWRLRNKMEYSAIAHAFLGETFTLAQLREVHEAVLRRGIDPANFRRQILTSEAIKPTGQRLTGTSHRPPRLYRYNTAVNLADQGPLVTNSQKQGQEI